MKDLVLLTADKNAQFALKGALARPEALGIRTIEFEFRVHPGRDGGTRRTGPDVLALERRRFNRALLVLDFEGCGTDLPNAIALEAELDGRLFAHWKGAAKSVVIEPELDVWIWGASNAVEQVIEWPAGKSVRDWLREKGFAFDVNENRPDRKRRWRPCCGSQVCRDHLHFTKASPKRSAFDAAVTRLLIECANN